MSEALYSVNCPSALLLARRGQTWLARLQGCHWLLLAYPVFLHLVSRPRSADEALVVDGSAKYQVAATAVYGVYVAYLVMRSPLLWLKSLFRRPLLWWTFYLVLAVLSSLWSVLPLLTVFRSGQAVIFFILIVHAMRSLDSYEDCIKLQLLFGMILILCATYTFGRQVYPAEGLSLKSLHGWGFPHCLVGVLFVSLPMRNQSWKISLYIILVVLVVSTAAKAYLAFTIGLWFFIYSCSFSGRNSFLWAVSFVLLILLLFFPQEALHLFFPGKEMHMILTGHGRLPVWETMAEEFVVHRPIHGYGFGLGDKLSYISEGLSFRISHTHNIILAAVMNLGAVGGVLIVLFCLDVALTGWRCLDQRWRACSIAGLVAIIFATLFTTSISSDVSSTWLSHAMIFIGVVSRRLFQSRAG
ncbi:MAG: O-antigen ligase family protein [Planctomycetota bacterium]|jgi:O-antigen ligase